MKEQLRLASWGVIAFGTILLLASLFADPLGLGRPGTSFGWKQILGTLIGVALTVVGLLWSRRLDADESA